MKRTLAAIGMLLLVASLVSPVLSAGNDQTDIRLNADISPELFTASFTITIPVSSSTLDDLNASANLSLQGGNLLGLLNARGYSPQLENIVGTVSLSGSAETRYSPDEGKVYSNSSEEATANLTLYGNKTQVNIVARIVTASRNVFSTVLNSGSSTRTYTINANMTSPDGTSISLVLSGSHESIATETLTNGSGSASGHVSINEVGQEIVVDINAVYSYSLNLTSGELIINATIDIVASNYLMASQIYMTINQLIQLLNLSSYVTVEPPSLMNPTVRVIVNYHGYLNMTAAPTAAEPGIGGFMNLLPTNTTLLLPTDISASQLNTTLSYNSSATVNNGSFTVDGRLEGSIRPAPAFVNASLQLSAHYDSNQSAVVIDGSLELESPCAHYSGFLALKELAASISESGNVSFQGAVSGYGGVRFLVDGREVSTVDLENATGFSGLAIIYEDLVYYSPNRTAIAIGENVSLPLLIRGITLNGTNSLIADLPFDSVIVLGNLSLEAPDVANVIVENGSKITGELVFAFTSPDNTSIPLSNATLAGYVVAVRNVSGMLDLRIKLTTDVGNGTLALFVLHDNGTTSIITDVTVDNGYLVARVPASSTYAPVILSASGGETNTNTTSKTASSSTTTSSPETSTTPPPGTTTSIETSIYTTVSTPPTTGTTEPRTNTTGTASESTPPAGFASGPTATTGQSGTTPESPAGSGSQEEKPAGYGGKAGLIAAGVAILVVVAALLLVKR